MARDQSQPNRRLAAILVADLVGYSRLLERDEAGTIARFGAARAEIMDPCITTHGGHTVRMAGDGALIEFPSAVEAAQCAIDVQRQMAKRNAAQPELEPLVFRVGISIGDIVEEADNLHGSGINIAARLEALCEPGQVLLSEEAANQIEGKVDARLCFEGERRLKNIERPVRVWQMDPAAPSAGPEPAKSIQQLPAGRTGLLAAMILFAVIGAGLWLSLTPDAQIEPTTTAQAPAPIAQSKPTLAVLPFTTKSSGPEQDYLGDGIAEDLITDLSRLSNLVVIARSSSFRYRGQTPAPQDVGEDLGVSHLIEGSVRKAGDRVRVSVQLIDATNGQQLWAQRFDRVLDDIFTIQDEIARKTVARLSIELAGAESDQLGTEATSNFAAYELFLRGQNLFQEYDRQRHAQAKDLYREAIALDPDFGRAYGALAVALARGTSVGWSNQPKEDRDRALELARAAIRLSPHLPQTHWALSYVHHNRREFEQALAAASRAVDLVPNYADGYGLLALINNSVGRAEEAIDNIRHGMRLNPHFSWDYPYNLGRALYVKGEYAAAAGQLRQALERNSAAPFPRLYLTAALVRLGNDEDAEWQVMQLETDQPEMTLSSLEQTLPLAEGPHKTKLFADLRKAGMAE